MGVYCLARLLWRWFCAGCLVLPQRMVAVLKSQHQLQGEEFIRRAGKIEFPKTPRMPPPKTRKLLADLVLEETVEKINALGFRVEMTTNGLKNLPCKDKESFKEVIDACGDIMFVVRQTLSACGVHDEILDREICRSNMTRFKPGYTFAENGKLMRSPDWEPPNISQVIEDSRENQKAVMQSVEVTRNEIAKAEYFAVQSQHAETVEVALAIRKNKNFTKEHESFVRKIHAEAMAALVPIAIAGYEQDSNFDLEREAKAVQRDLNRKYGSLLLGLFLWPTIKSFLINLLIKLVVAWIKSKWFSKQFDGAFLPADYMAAVQGEAENYLKGVAD